MRVASFDLHPYRLPLTDAVVWNGERRETREGVLLRLHDERGRAGWGDAAPLPGFSRETVAEAEAALRALLPALDGRDLDARDVLRPDGPFHTALDAAGLPSSARFALDLALADLAAQDLGRTLPQALHPDPPVVLPLNGLLMGDREAVVAHAGRLAAEGWAAAKLKVGRQAIEDDAETVRAVSGALGGAVLRLDANRAWTADQARAFARAVEGVPLDYVEEPTPDAGDHPALWLDTGLPVALDETLQEPGGAAHVRGWAAAAVLKPTLVGGLAAALRLAAAARAVGVRAVLSASFESGVGLRGVAALAAATGAEPAGLDTYRWLAEDVVPPLPLDRPRVDLPALFAASPEVRVP
ncbi:o-succinylbenzoate synthase [Rubrivirga litoralis]|uniref:o-succinylbenzoate synthase n=1 Tax=Rubrivirga litoralis TaxID=3075598 RepID=A0ABU3BN05_9BACT|nr:o-succinylbenzoate synthase [Rubrivirga sp. F394]MDT0630669.1 o-succinylbenzoate synthase [Rubrivirga sp. F394]